jgi:hypothetical protein
MIIKATCIECKKEFSLTVTAGEYDSFREGAFVQDAFPNLTPGERELLISSMCETCFDKLFEREEEP